MEGVEELTVALWVRFEKPSSRGTVMTLYHSRLERDKE